LPPSYLIAKIICGQLANAFNVSLQQVGIPVLLPIVLLLSTIIIPAIVVSFPVIKTAKATVYDALNQNLKGGTYKQSSIINRFIAKAKNISIMTRYAIRNQLRDRLKTCLTLGALAVASCILMTSLNLQKSFSTTITGSRDLFPDAIFTLDNYYDAQKLKSIYYQFH
jgi:hypothetical protein